MAEVTNYIDRLVAELCPDGVEYRSLESLGKRNKGTAITASKMRSLEPGNKDLRIFAAGSTFVDTDSSNIPAKDILHGPAIIVKSRGYIGFEYYEKSFTHKNEMWSYTLDSNIVNQKFIYYYLLTQAYYLQELARSKSVKLPQLSVKDTDSLEVPVPPLEIQEAIVEILDKFTNLEAELEAELEARTLQYEYYRDSLLASFSESAVKFYSIEELFTTRNGYTPSKSNSSYWENGTVPWFRMEDIRENGGVLSEALQSVHESALKKGGMFPAGSIIVATSATIGEHALINVDFLCNQRFTVLTPKEEFKSLLLPKFLYYYSFVLDRWCLANTTQSSFASVDMKRFKKFEFPLPSLEEQQRIVDILDRFDALTTSLSEGLPAELAARRSQYEYYRDQLLTFPRKGENQ